MRVRTLLATFLLAPALLPAQGNGVSPEELLKPLKDSWPTYNGDYSGKRYSALSQINRSNVKHLTLAWMSRVTPGPGNLQGGSGRFRRGGGASNVIIGG
jgi:alcohol dehydrogenase (cytochrome c)